MYPFCSIFTFAVKLKVRLPQKPLQLLSRPHDQSLKVSKIHPSIHTYRQTDRQAVRQTRRQTQRDRKRQTETDRDKERQSDRQTEADRPEE